MQVYVNLTNDKSAALFSLRILNGFAQKGRKKEKDGNTAIIWKQI